MANIFKWIHQNAWVLKYLHKTLFFNFYYLPFKQAVKLPILLYKPKFYRLKGTVSIKSERIYRGMIILGKYGANIYPNSGVLLDIRGTVVFNGGCFIGNDSYISVSEKGFLQFGSNFMATASEKIVCYENIKFGNDVLVGWNCVFCDNDFHKVIDKKTSKTKETIKKVEIGNHVWIANSCNIMKSASIPSHVIVASHSLVNKALDVKNNSLVAGIPAKLKREEVDWIF